MSRHGTAIDTRAAAHAGLVLQDLRVGYRGRAVIEGLALGPVPPASVVALVGPNGAGKSTLMRGVAGLCRAGGTLRLDGEDITRLRPAERLQRIGYLPQALPQPTPLVVYESLLASVRAGRPSWGRPHAEARIEAVVERLELRPLALRRLDELSGGQRQMVGLAQVLVRQPGLLLLDEPTSALDLRWQIKVLQVVREEVQHHGGIALVALHDLNLALRFCDRIAVLAAGRLLVCGAPGEVFDETVLRHTYGVEGRVERCSLGHPVVVVDRVAAG
ncbi:ABC transporter ATP-binding protein [Aquabacterium sp. A7-Y]|uniref:ABC transporter ATP-binding protein n=1 Tax=Aquabacterium sp. A7-Y TaxID=1349605 RepID=UPI00223D2200|nr:ABC transporter ATP-binding protein [Aquabacterium sp. A7-Y]MCW7539446.1 ABC transporter ATP-binding protein [Aquabacterium sp. A7-Y]